MNQIVVWSYSCSANFLDDSLFQNIKLQKENRWSAASISYRVHLKKQRFYLKTISEGFGFTCLLFLERSNSGFKSVPSQRWCSIVLSTKSSIHRTSRWLNRWRLFLRPTFCLFGVWSIYHRESWNLILVVFFFTCFCTELRRCSVFFMSDSKNKEFLHSLKQAQIILEPTFNFTFNLREYQFFPTIHEVKQRIYDWDKIVFLFDPWTNHWLNCISSWTFSLPLKLHYIWSGHQSSQKHRIYSSILF